MPVLAYTDVQLIENYRVSDVLYGKKWLKRASARAGTATRVPNYQGVLR